jgi:hypothetical protein
MRENAKANGKPAAARDVLQKMLEKDRTPVSV